jgi:serine protease
MLELLNSAAKVSARTESQAYPQNILSFAIDYQARPDVAAERQKIGRILGGSGFNLFPYSAEDDPQLLILQFPTVVREQSPDYLFEEAQALCDALGIQSVTPDIDPPYSDVLTTPPGTEGVGDLIRKLCTTTVPPNSNPGWGPSAQQAEIDTFQYTNCVPQHEDLNQKDWGRA